MEHPNSTFKESRPPKKFSKFSKYMALMSSVIEDEIDKEVWRKAMVKDDAQDIMARLEGKLVPGGSSRSTFIAKREC